MDLTTTLSIVQTILTAIQTLDQLKAMFSFSDFERQLADLQNTVNYVKSVLEDAEARQDAINSQEKFYIQELKDALYDADDVLDEFVTIVKRKQLTEVSDKFSAKVRSFVSRLKYLTLSLSHKVKEVNKKLDAIVSKSSKFFFKVDTKPIKFKKQDTTSFVSVHDPIIGRGEDLEKIVEMLLGSDDVYQPNNNVLALAIVGMGGLGKTAFAQLVYNDPRITSAFQLKSWTCIADHDKWSLTYILGKILGNNHDLTTIEHMHSEVRKQLEGRKYLLVLDDVWTEKYREWQELEKFLMVGESGSRILVTTRSKKTAQIIGGARVHVLQGLSENDSWQLFERMAFRKEQSQNLDEDLVKLGKDIVKKCSNVPLAIRVVGSLLHGESKAKWISLRDKELAKICESDDTMNKILSVSYQHLDSSLKNCFAYCAVFPKNFVIHKQMLISLWMAHGYINVEFVGEEYFRILLQRCFFQDVKEENMGEVMWFKIHDLLHDIAEQAVGNEICRLKSDPQNVNKKVRHLSLLYGFCPQKTFNKAHIRTCLQVIEFTFFTMSRSENSSDQLLVGNSIANWTSLRSLDLRYLGAKSLPKSISKLLHLRYLDLSWSSNLELLPNSITKLVNLQTLELLNCVSLEELPKDVCMLVDLSTLNITGCDKLRHMPSKLAMLSRLHTLGLFVVGGISSYEKQCFDGLEDLSSLNILKGSLDIRIEVRKNAKYVKDDHGGGAYLINKVHLNRIHINFINRADENTEWEHPLLEEMQPHADIRKLTLRGYNCEKMPRWPMKEDNSTLFYFPNLVKLQINDCQQLRSLPALEKLPHLKKLVLFKLLNVEYLVNVNLEAPSLGEGISFFPSLEQLDINKLPKLKGWWPVVGELDEHLIGEPFPGFAQLKNLGIYECPMLKSIPICSRLNSVWVSDSHRFMRQSDIDQLHAGYKCLLPSKSKSRIIAISYLKNILAAHLVSNETD